MSASSKKIDYNQKKAKKFNIATPNSTDEDKRHAISLMDLIPNSLQQSSINIKGNNNFLSNGQQIESKLLSRAVSSDIQT